VSYVSSVDSSQSNPERSVYDLTEVVENNAGFVYSFRTNKRTHRNHMKTNKRIDTSIPVPVNASKLIESLNIK